MLFSSALVGAETVTLVGEDDWYPYSAFKDGRLQGFAVDIIDAAYAAVGIKAQFVSAPYARCLMLVRTGQATGCFDSLNDARQGAEFLFHKEPIFRAAIGIYAHNDAALQKVAVVGLKGHRVGFTHGYTYGDEVETDTQILREPAPTDISNLRKLVLGRSEYSLVYTRVVDYLSAAYPGELKDKLRQVGTVSEDRLFVSFSRSRPEAGRFADLLDKGLLAIRANGVYAGIEKKWKSPAL
ncbi:substrate-binding periplasmic protein [Undibacterium sp.]|uniref:substrate-binding periplasmic protein n=1 Tax=Undibacterium sp. TaxID=1914977 RepID=UPI00374D2FCA